LNGNDVGSQGLARSTLPRPMLDMTIATRRAALRDRRLTDVDDQRALFERARRPGSVSARSHRFKLSVGID